MLFILFFFGCLEIKKGKGGALVWLGYQGIVRFGARLGVHYYRNRNERLTTLAFVISSLKYKF